MTAELSTPSSLPAIALTPQIAVTEQASTDPAGPAFAAVLANTPGTPLPVNGKVLPATGTAPPHGLTTDGGRTDDIASKAVGQALTDNAALVITGGTVSGTGTALPKSGTMRADHHADDDQRPADTAASAADDATPPITSTGTSAIAIAAALAPAVRPAITPAPPSSSSRGSSVPPPSLAPSTKPAIPTRMSAADLQPPRTELPASIPVPDSRPAPGKRPVPSTPTGNAPVASDAAVPAMAERLRAPSDAAAAPTAGSAATLPLSVPFLTTNTSGDTSVIAVALVADAAVPVNMTPSSSSSPPSSSPMHKAPPSLAPPDPAAAQARVAAPPSATVSPAAGKDDLLPATAPRASNGTREAASPQTTAAPANPPETVTLAAPVPSTTLPSAMPMRSEAPLAPPNAVQAATQTAHADQPKAPATSPAAVPSRPAARVGGTANIGRAERDPVASRPTLRTTAPPSYAHDLQPMANTRDAALQAPAPTPDTALVQAAPTDLGTLVDRLIAARQAGQTSQITAHVAHADFGRIDLNFASDAAGLTVGMRSHDPDFAPSVQAAASVAPPQASSDSRSPQDTPQQQAASTSSGASQSFARDQGRAAPGQAGRETAHSGGPGTPSQRASATDRREDPRGVYA